jgi:hypothetical protein
MFDRALRKFKVMRQVGTQPEFLDYLRAQMMLIGHKAGKEDKKGEDGEDLADMPSRFGNDDLDRMQHLSSPTCP